MMKKFPLNAKEGPEHHTSQNGPDNPIFSLTFPRESRPFPRPGPRHFPSLGWLQGILHRAPSLGIILSTVLILLGILQDKNVKHSYKKSSPKGPDLSSLPNQKWLIRRRDHTGKLRHVKTLDHEPSDEELKMFGAGNYSILTTKPHLQGCKSVTVPIKGETASMKTFPVPSEGSLKRLPATRSEGFEPKKLKSKLVLKRKIEKPPAEPILEDRSSIKPPSIDYSPSADDIATTSEHTTMTETDTGSVKTNEPRSTVICAKCLEPSSSLVRCGFCREIFCKDSLDECYEHHECPGSMVCSKCGRRVENELVEIADHCHQYFCSPKCMNGCWMKNFMKTGCFGCTVGSNDEKEEKEVDAEMEERDGYEEETSPEEEESTEEEEVEEMCDGVPKRIACRRCQKENCQGRLCDGYCDKCHFHCEDRCEYDGECKFCQEFDNCEVRCKEAPDRCDKRRCTGFRCEERWVSGNDCDRDCGNCSDEGCYFWDHSPDRDEVDEE